ncbi:cysteine proteinase inhibitor-like isoform X2 [Phragmites australis]|uniref:cysteine proteinase inhibitor-like isoform X2 n=1 Tax=Phragmites australis TaxID=29695 RepID=UPI002D796C58|nr:cysteine proteinase inhibitor-like isoform X2 [Phragmites australis]
MHPIEMRKYRAVGLVAALLVLLAVSYTRNAEEEEGAMADGGPLAGGIHDAPAGRENDLHDIDLARFAVDEHNKKANALLEFDKLVKVKQQVVAGTMYYLTIEVKDGEVKKLYEARVWEKPWMNFKELVDFKPAEGGVSA